MQKQAVHAETGSSCRNRQFKQEQADRAQLAVHEETGSLYRNMQFMQKQAVHAETGSSCRNRQFMLNLGSFDQATSC